MEKLTIGEYIENASTGTVLSASELSEKTVSSISEILYFLNDLATETEMVTRQFVCFVDNGRCVQHGYGQEIVISEGLLIDLSETIANPVVIDGTPLEINIKDVFIKYIRN